jgi:hypothetical protein
MRIYLVCYHGLSLDTCEQINDEDNAVEGQVQEVVRRTFAIVDELQQVRSYR